jgi:hypothetical protein
MYAALATLVVLTRCDRVSRPCHPARPKVSLPLQRGSAIMRGEIGQLKRNGLLYFASPARVCFC